MKKLPQTVYLYWTSDDPPCLVAYESFTEIPSDEDGVLVGSYQLVDTAQLRWQATLRGAVSKRKRA